MTLECLITCELINYLLYFDAARFRPVTISMSAEGPIGSFPHTLPAALPEARAAFFKIAEISKAVACGGDP